MHSYPIVLIQWETEDGVRYNTMEKCKYHNKYHNIFKTLCNPLGEIAEDNKAYDFSNGGGFLQHNVNQVNNIKRQFLQYVATEGLVPESLVYITETTGNGKNKTTTKNINIDAFLSVGYYLVDTGMIYNVWKRLVCIDSLGREWGNIYFTLNPGKGKKKIWNKRKNSNKYWN